MQVAFNANVKNEFLQLTVQSALHYVAKPIQEGMRVITILLLPDE
jgi:hypothetical protein